ncbi:SURF1 family protein [Glycomyces buryatensis]|uniref:SURF1 family cytochrome oxidase biogenesis protein n=1 Tax=Glycomyces buryatensis TaxID=2570927 RepID=UPI00145628BD|nr:SURF1 family protein [Glycomyces buryatensis]
MIKRDPARSAQWRSLVTGRWLALTLAGAVVMVTCVLLSQWQWGRAVERAAANEVIAAADESFPVDEVLPAGEALDSDARWTLVEASGTYDTSSEIVLRTQTNESVNGYEVVTPLVLEDGTAILVDRGFFAADDSGGIPSYPAAPEGEVTVTGRVYESEPAGGSVTEPQAPGDPLEARRLNLDQLGGHLDYQLRSAWLADIEPAEGLSALETPSFKSWQNYSYAVQWALFAALVPIGWVALARRELKETAEAESGSVPDDDLAADEPATEDGPVADGSTVVSPRTGSSATAE